MTDTIEERAREIAQHAATQTLTEGWLDNDLLALAILTALTEAYERGQRDMQERCSTVAVEQCGGGFHDRKRMRSAIAALSEHEKE